MNRIMSAGILLLSCTASSVSAQSPVSTPGMHALTLPESERRFTLVIPAGYDGSEAVPLIMSLHYGGNVTPFYGRGLLEQLVEPVLKELGAIIVAPDSAADGWANPTAEAHVLELLEYVESNYNVDSTRTLLTGYSMGAMGTWYLAPRHPELFEVAIPMAGRPQADSTDLDWRTPTYAINSTADELIALEPTREAVEVLQAKGAPIQIAVIDAGITHYQIPRYRPYLQAAIPWIRNVWND